jgi:hypothetical protein
MDWQKIKTECPKGWEVFNNYIGKTFLDLRGKDRDLKQHSFRIGFVKCFRTRNLFDFFDERKIIGTVYYDDALGIFYFLIDTVKDIYDSSSFYEVFTNRANTEEFLFTKAFSILESQLNNGGQK